jgi:hypothetical protein
LIDRIAIIERGIEGTSVYLIRVSYLENNGLDLGSDDKSFLFSLLFVRCLLMVMIITTTCCSSSQDILFLILLPKVQ